MQTTKRFDEKPCRLLNNFIKIKFLPWFNTFFLIKKNIQFWLKINWKLSKCVHDNGNFFDIFYELTLFRVTLLKALPGALSRPWLSVKDLSPLTRSNRCQSARGEECTISRLRLLFIFSICWPVQTSYHTSVQFLHYMSTAWMYYYAFDVIHANKARSLLLILSQ